MTGKRVDMKIPPHKTGSKSLSTQTLSPLVDLITSVRNHSQQVICNHVQEASWLLYCSDARDWNWGWLVAQVPGTWQLRTQVLRRTQSFSAIGWCLWFHTPLSLGSESCSKPHTCRLSAQSSRSLPLSCRGSEAEEELSVQAPTPPVGFKQPFIWGVPWRK